MGRQGELARPHGLTETTLCRWKTKFGGLELSEARRLKSLEEENRQLKRLVSDRALNLQVVKELLGESGDARSAADGRHECDVDRRDFGTPSMSQAIIQASWNWPMGRKDIEVYGAKGYLIAPNATSLRLRRGQQVPEESIIPAPRSAPSENEFQFLAAVVRGRYRPAETDPSSLTNNVTVVRILDAARRSAATGKTVRPD